MNGHRLTEHRIGVEGRVGAEELEREEIRPPYLFFSEHRLEDERRHRGIECNRAYAGRHGGSFQAGIGVGSSAPMRPWYRFSSTTSRRRNCSPVIPSSRMYPSSSAA